MVRWRINGIYNADAESVYNEIKEIGYDVTPEKVVDHARDANTVLHSLFEWRDDVAAELYRQKQARGIITNLVTVKETVTESGSKEKIFVRSFVSSGERDHVYRPIQSVVVQQDEYTLLLARAIRELQAFRTKYQTLSSDLGWLFDQIDEMAG